MAVIFNAEEVYQMGVEIEKNGEAFYRAAAETSADEDAKRLFTGLADWERGHIRLFEQLKASLPSELSPDQELDTDEQKHLYLKAAADSHVFVANKDVRGLLDGCQDPAAVLRVALGFEKDSVVLYTSMKTMVPQALGRDKIERLIEEEILHVAMLQQRLTALSED